MAFLIAAVLAINFAFGFPRLSRYSAVDEPYWTYDRTPKFWHAIANRKWKSTNINDKPGVTVAIVSGAGLLSSDPLTLRSIRQKPKDEELLNKYADLNLHMRLPIFFFTLLMLLVFYLLLQKLFNYQVALFSIIFIGLSPILMGISLIINPDSLLWIFAPLSIISYFVYKKENKYPYLYLCGIFLGLSLLTKYVANILFVFFLGLIFLEYILNKDEKNSIRDFLRRSLIDYAKMTLFALITFCVLFPATWVEPEMILRGTFLSQAFESTWYLFVGLVGLILMDMFFVKNKITGWILDKIAAYKTAITRIGAVLFLALAFFAFINVYSGMKIYDFEAILASPKSSGSAGFRLDVFLGKFFSDFYPLLFGLTPMALIFFFFSVGTNLKKKIFQRKNIIVFYLTLFIIFYYIASSVNGVGATVRYQVILFPLASIIAALGLYNFINLKRVKKYLSFPLAAIFAIVISATSLYFVRPDYFAYASFLLPKQYVLNLKGMGDGGYEAAQYLNALPDSDKLTIWTDKGAVCESFRGRCITGFNKKDVIGVPFDYFVATADRKKRSLSMSRPLKNYFDFEKLYDETNQNFVFKISVGNRASNFLRIVKADEIIVNK